MNKQELIERIKKLDEPYLKAEFVLELVKQLDEPEKVKVPQCVHKYIQEEKEYNWDLQDLMKYVDDEDSEEFQRWFYHECNQETLARAWLDGYEVEEEKRYRMKMSNANFDGNIQILSFKKNSFFWSSNWERYKTHHTRKELEDAGFGWVFDCPGIEIEEVE